MSLGIIGGKPPMGRDQWVLVRHNWSGETMRELVEAYYRYLQIKENYRVRMNT